MNRTGIGGLPDLIAARRLFHGMRFNFLFVGPTGIGKTTLINSLFNVDFGDATDFERAITKVEIRDKVFNQSNMTAKIRYSISESKGFNNQQDKSESYRTILDFIEGGYEDFLKRRLTVDSMYDDINDSRVHCCVYMISPLGLKAIDKVALKHLHRRVCLLPVIGKSDLLSEAERQIVKQQVKQFIIQNDIQIYGDEELPLTVAGGGRCGNSEFSKLKQLIRDSAVRFVSVTNELNEQYRSDLLINGDGVQLTPHELRQPRLSSRINV